MVETQSTGLETFFDNQRVLALPLNGRQATALIKLAGAAQSAPPSNTVGNKNYPTAVAYSIEGSPGNSTNYLLDGGSNNRSEEHTSELQSRPHLVCRLLLGKKNTSRE